MRLLIIFFLLRTSHFGFGQELSLNIPISDNRSDGGFQIAALPEGGYIVLSQSKCHDDLPYTNCLGLLKLDKQGNTVWSKLFDGNPDTDLNPSGRTMVIHDDTIFVANEVWKNNQKEIRLMSFDLEGDLLFERDLAIPYTTELQIRGMIENNNMLLLYGEVANGEHKIFIEVMDLKCNLLEEHLIGDPFNNKRFMELNIMQNGGYILAYGEGDFLQTSVVVTKLDKDFNIMYSKKMLESGEPFMSVNIYEMEDKGFMLAWQKDLMFSLADTFPYPTAIYKLDSLFNVEWEYVFAHKASKGHISTVKTSDDKLFGIGATDYYTVQSIYPDRWLDGFCFIINGDGTLIWERNIADIRESFGGRLWHGLETDNGFVMVGDIDKKNLTGIPYSNNPDVWFLTLDKNGCWNGNCNEYIVITGDTTSITDAEDLSPPEFDISAYPNPAGAVLTIEYKEFNTNSEGVACVFDSYGNKILEVKLLAPKTTINLSNLTDGVYFVSHLIAGRLLKTQKVIVHH